MRRERERRLGERVRKKRRGECMRMREGDKTRRYKKEEN